MKKSQISIIFSFFLVLSILNFNTVPSEKPTIIETDENTLYVGGSGPANYSKIQNAIDNSSNGYTIFVYSGEYLESIIINKSIILQGENKQNTILNSETRTAINIKSNNISISGFKIITLSYSEVKIDIRSDNSTINNNIIHGVVFLLSSNNNIIFQNEIINGGIRLFDSSSNKIIDNIIGKHRFTGVKIGQYSLNNIVSYNTIKFCVLGIDLFDKENKIFSNNFYFNFLDGRISYRDGNYSTWHHNYWGKPRVTPKLLFGFGLFDYGSPYCIDFDLNPSLRKNKYS